MFQNNIDPCAFHIFSFCVRWYSLAYILGFLFMFLLFPKRVKEANLNLNKKNIEDFIFFNMIAVIIGGRIGYIIFYNLSYYLQHPITIFFVWQGGMSFHGALISVILTSFLLNQKYQVNLLSFFDIAATIAPIGIFLGRLANFINSELFGSITTVPWAVIFTKIDQNPRHPSQIYEALLEGLVIFIITNILWHKKFYLRQGFITGIALLLYGVFRIFVEFFRLPDYQVGYIVGHISMGQLLSLPMIVIGIILVKRK